MVIRLEVQVLVLRVERLTQMVSHSLRQMAATHAPVLTEISPVQKKDVSALVITRGKHTRTEKHSNPRTVVGIVNVKVGRWNV